MKSNDCRKRYFIDAKAITTKEFIEIDVPVKNQRVRITITKKHIYDPVKQKMITDQVVHRSRYLKKEDVKND